MPLSFHSISIFRESVNSLCRKERDGYHLCRTDICDLFVNKSFDEIWNLNYKLRDLDNLRLIKVRLQNSFQNLSSSDGFRIIICCNRKHEHIVFLNIYPKRGKLGMIDQPKEDYKIQLKKYLEQFKNGQLIEHNINDNCAEITPL